MKRKQPDVSLAAFHSLDQNKISETKRLILNALNTLGRASSEQLADFLGKPYDVIWKRCSDLKNEKQIFASDFKVLTKKNRFARQWIICDESQSETEREHKVLEGPSLVQYSRKINAIAKSVPSQLNLL